MTERSVDKKTEGRSTEEALSTERALKLALEYLRDNQHYIADNERHAYVMEYNAFVERLEALAEQPAQQEPVAWIDICEKGQMSGLRYWSEPDNRHEVALYTSPPSQRTWVGLTDEERNWLRKRNQKHDDYAKAVEALLKEKNT